MIPLLPKIRSLKFLNFVTSEAVEKNDLGIVGCKLIDGTGKFLPESKRGVQLLGCIYKSRSL
jgi:hypothetical protein